MRKVNSDDFTPGMYVTFSQGPFVAVHSAMPFASMSSTVELTDMHGHVFQLLTGPAQLPIVALRALRKREQPKTLQDMLSSGSAAECQQPGVIIVNAADIQLMQVDDEYVELYRACFGVPADQDPYQGLAAIIGKSEEECDDVA